MDFSHDYACFLLSLVFVSGVWCASTSQVLFWRIRVSGVCQLFWRVRSDMAVSRAVVMQACWGWGGNGARMKVPYYWDGSGRAGAGRGRGDVMQEWSADRPWCEWCGSFLASFKSACKWVTHTEAQILQYLRYARSLPIPG